MKWKKQNIRNKISYLEYYKFILERVSFCHILFNKEYNKAKCVIDPVELTQLNKWLNTKCFYKRIKRNFKTSRLS